MELIPRSPSTPPPMLANSTTQGHIVLLKLESDDAVIQSAYSGLKSTADYLMDDVKYTDTHKVGCE